MDAPEPAGPDLVALLYRADWTKLRLSARVSGTVDFTVLARQMPMANPLGLSAPSHPLARLGVRRFAGTLWLAPGGQFGVEITEPVIDETNRVEFVFLRQHGFRSRTGNAPQPPPYPELLCPARLLNGCTLGVRGEVTETAVPGRRALAVMAMPVHLGRVAFLPRPERIEVLVDADTGILLRSEETFDGQTLRVTELSEVTFGEPGDAFTPSDEEDDPFGGRGFSAFPDFSGPGWTAARTMANAAGPILGSVITHASCPQDAGQPDPDAAMPSDDDEDNDSGGGASADEPAGLAGISDELVYAMYASGRAEFSGTLHTWSDLGMSAQRAGSSAGRHGWEGLGSVLDAVGDRVGVVHKVFRVQRGSAGAYRVERVMPQRKDEPRILTCDGETLWREFARKVVISPAAPLRSEFAEVIDTSPLLECQLTTVRETMLGGRRAFAIRAGGPRYSFGGFSMIWAGDIVVDAELGIVLRFVRREGGKPAFRCEFRDVMAGGFEDADFRGQVPPGLRVEHADASLVDDLLVSLPEPVRVAAKTAGTGLRAARGFLQYWAERHGR